MTDPTPERTREEDEYAKWTLHAAAQSGRVATVLWAPFAGRVLSFTSYAEWCRVRGHWAKHGRLPS